MNINATQLESNRFNGFNELWNCPRATQFMSNGYWKCYKYSNSIPTEYFPSVKMVWMFNIMAQNGTFLQNGFLTTVFDLWTSFLWPSIEIFIQKSEFKELNSQNSNEGLFHQHDSLAIKWRLAPNDCLLALYARLYATPSKNNHHFS